MKKMLGIFLEVTICSSHSKQVGNTHESQNGVKELPGGMRTNSRESPSLANVPAGVELKSKGSVGGKGQTASQERYTRSISRFDN